MCYNILMDNQIFSKDEIRENLEPVFRIYNVRKAMLFGSYAKDTANSQSDVDILVDSDLKGMKFVGLMEDMRNALGDKEVDVLDKTHIEKDSDIANEISKTGVLIYER